MNKFINEDKTVITLPVPLGSTIYQVTTKCGDFCTFQQELFDKIFPPVKEGRCGEDKPCHTVPWQVYKSQLEFHNMEFVLENWGTWVFSTEEAAEQRMKEVVEGNRKKMRELGFSIREDGYGLTPEMDGVESAEGVNLVYTSPRGKKITFVKYTDNRKNDVRGYTSYMCPRCHNKFRSILGERAWADRGLDSCCVRGCENEMEEYGYVVDFREDEVAIVSESV